MRSLWHFRKEVGKALLLFLVIITMMVVVGLGLAFVLNATVH